MMSEIDMVQQEYQKDHNLKKEDVKMLQVWLEGQPHLPKMTELEVIWFLKSCYYSNEFAKKTIDNHFTMKTMSPEILGKKDVKSKAIQNAMDTIVFSVLPKRTSEGYAILMCHTNDSNAENFVYNDSVKIFDMVTMLDIYKNGTHEGIRFIFDMGDFGFGHLVRLGIVSLKKFLFFLQDGMPIRLKGLHFFNITPVVDKLINIMKPFMKNEVIEMIHFHHSVQDLEKFVPLEYLPSDYGGKHHSNAVLHEEMKKILMENADFFEYQDTQLVDETKRPEKPRNVSDIFGVEGTFKKLDLD